MSRPASPVEIGGLERRLRERRPELVAHCTRVLGGASEADDAVQETFLRAWRSFDRFEGRASLRTWLYRIATNVCLDMLQAKQRRARPLDLATEQASGTPGAPAVPSPGANGARPVFLGGAAPTDDDPAEHAVAREGVHLAFVVALVALPPRQRSVLILREVLRWRASEVAELLGTSVASINSALERARANIAARRGTIRGDHPLDEESRALLRRYTDAFDRYDVDSLVSLLR